jgi:GNAT superfamily N-acetyltransferase
MALETRGVSIPGEFTEALQVIARCFEVTPHEARRSLQRFAPILPAPVRMENTRVALVEGRVASVVHVHDLQVYGRGRRLWRMGGLAEVSTLPECRRQGYASAVLKDAIGYMEEAGFDLSMLIATGPAALYAKLGWRACPDERFTFHLGAFTVPQQTGQYRIRSIDWEADLPALQALYDAHNRSRLGPVVRSNDYWRKLVLPARSFLLGLVAEREGTPVAYSIANVGGILEAPHLEGEGQAGRELVCEALRTAHERGAEKMLAQAASVPVARSIAAELPDKAVARRDYPYLMLRPISPEFEASYEGGEVVHYFIDYF